MNFAGFLKAVFNFFVGDWILLIGVGLSFVLVFALLQCGGLPLRHWFVAVVFVVGLVFVIGLSLARERRSGE
jgi:hypothetical protein